MKSTIEVTKTDTKGLLPLWNHQSEALDAIKANQSDFPIMTIKLPTGSGKSRLIEELAQEYTSQGKSVLVVTSRVRLLEQLAESISVEDLNLFYSSQKNTGLLTVTTYQSLSNLPEGFLPHIIILDESHNLGSDLRQGKIKDLSSEGAIRINLSATPDTTDGKLVYDLPIINAVEQGILSSFKVILALVKTNTTNNNSDATISETEDFKSKMLELYKKTIVDNGYNKTIAFVSNTKKAEAYTKLFNDSGIRAGCTHSYMSQNEVNEQLRRFKEGEIEILFNVDQLTEGYNLPTIDSVMVLDGTRIPKREVQRVGRGLRQDGDNKTTLIVEVVPESQIKEYALFSSIVGASEAYTYSSQQDVSDEKRSLSENLFSIDLSGIQIFIDAQEVMSMSRNSSEGYWTISEISREAGYSADALSLNPVHMDLLALWASQYADMYNIPLENVYRQSEGHSTPSRIDTKLAEISSKELLKRQDYVSLGEIARKLGFAYDNGSTAYFGPGARQELVDLIIASLPPTPALTLPHYVSYSGNYGRFFSKQLAEYIVQQVRILENYVFEKDIAGFSGNGARLFSGKDNGWQSVLTKLSQAGFKELGYFLPSRDMNNSKQYFPEMKQLFKVIHSDLGTKQEMIKRLNVNTASSILEAYWEIPEVQTYVREEMIKERKRALLELGLDYSEERVALIFKDFDYAHTLEYKDASAEPSVYYSKTGVEALSKLHEYVVYECRTASELADLYNKGRREGDSYKVNEEIIKQLLETIIKELKEKGESPYSPLGWNFPTNYPSSELGNPISRRSKNSKLKYDLKVMELLPMKIKEYILSLREG